MPFGISLGNSSSSNKVHIPRFLRPLFKEGANILQTGMSDLQSLFDPANNDFVAGFSPQEEIAQIIGTSRALDPEGAYATARDIFTSTAEGTPISEFLSSDVLDVLRRGGIDDSSVIETLTGASGTLPAAIEQLTGLSGESVGSTVQDIISRAVPGMDQLSELGSGLSPEVIEGLKGIIGREVPGMDTLSQIEGGLNSLSRDTLESTARGDYLYGGEAYDRAVEAAMNAFKPQMLSTFGAAGPGGASGTLAQESLGRAFADAFASQYGAERGRQLSAADTLQGHEFTDRGLTSDIASTLASLGLARDDRDLAGSTALGELGLADVGQQADINSTLASLGLARDDRDLAGANLNLEDIGQRSGIASLLADLGLNSSQIVTALGESGRDREFAGADLEARLADTERSRQLDAASALPDVAEADINLLRDLGGDVREMEQAELDAPREAIMQMLSLLFPGLNVNSLLGSESSGSGAALGFGT